MNSSGDWLFSVTTKAWHFWDLWKRLRQEKDRVPAKWYLWAFRWGCVCVEGPSHDSKTTSPLPPTPPIPPEVSGCVITHGAFHSMDPNTGSFILSSQVTVWFCLGLAPQPQLCEVLQIECETLHIPTQYGNHHPNIHSVIIAPKGVNIFNNKCWGKMMSIEFFIVLE